MRVPAHFDRRALLLWLLAATFATAGLICSQRTSEPPAEPPPPTWDEIEIEILGPPTHPLAGDAGDAGPDGP